MKTLDKKQCAVMKIITATTKTVDRIVVLYDRIKMDNETKKIKKKALKVLLYSLIALFLTLSVDIISTLFLTTFQKFVIDFGIDPYDSAFDKMLNFIAVASIISIIISSIIVIGQKRCCCVTKYDSTRDPTNPFSPLSPNYIGRHHHK